VLHEGSDSCVFHLSRRRGCGFVGRAFFARSRFMRTFGDSFPVALLGIQKK